MQNKELIRCLESKCLLERNEGSKAALAVLGALEAGEGAGIKALVAAGLVSEIAATQAVAECCHLPFRTLDMRALLPAVCRVVPHEFASRYRVLPIARNGNVVTLAMSLPLNLFAEDYVGFRTGLLIRREIVPASQLEKAIEYVYNCEVVPEKAEPDVSVCDVTEVAASSELVYPDGPFSFGQGVDLHNSVESQVLLQSWRENTRLAESEAAVVPEESREFVNSVEQASTLHSVLKSDAWSSHAEPSVTDSDDDYLAIPDELRNSIDIALHESLEASPLENALPDPLAPLKSLLNSAPDTPFSCVAAPGVPAPGASAPSPLVPPDTSMPAFPAPTEDNPPPVPLITEEGEARVSWQTLFARRQECPINWLQSLLLQGARLGATGLVLEPTLRGEQLLAWRVGERLVPVDSSILDNSARTIVMGEVFHFPACS